MRDIEGHNKAIESHIRKGIDERIEAVEEVMKTIEKQVVELKAKKENIVKKMNFIKKGLSNHELMERDLEDNLRLREKTVEVEVLKKEVEALEAKFENTNFDVLLKEKRKLKGKEDELIKNVRLMANLLANSKLVFIICFKA